jgi:hypothetical protein
MLKELRIDVWDLCAIAVLAGTGCLLQVANRLLRRLASDSEAGHNSTDGHASAQEY